MFPTRPTFVTLISVGMILQTTGMLLAQGATTNPALAAIRDAIDINPNRQSRLLNKPLEQRLEVMAVLVDRLMSEQSSTDSRCAAAFLLGALRFDEAAPILARYIALEASPSTKEQDRQGAWGTHPVVAALIRLGQPAQKEMLRLIAQSDDAQVRDLALAVIRGIHRDDDVVKLVLQKSIQRQPDADQKRRLGEALETLR